MINTLKNIKIKEMKYKTESIRELLCNAIYRGYHFYILNLGTHPTAYVEIPKISKFYRKHYDDIDILVHGGLTYSNEELRIGDNTKMTNSWFIGWDYAHYNDYLGSNALFGKFESDEFNKKWTTEEMIKDCFSVIDQLIEGENNE